MNYYSNLHDNLEIAKVHIEKILNRNGNYILSKQKNKYLLEYAFYDDTPFKIFNQTIYRGGTKGIKTQSSGSFYTTHQDLAERYAELESDSKVYAYNIKNLKLVNIDDLDNGSADEGIPPLDNSTLILFDGYYDRNGIQVCLFGRASKPININDAFIWRDFSNFEKIPISEIRNDSIAKHRRYDR